VLWSPAFSVSTQNAQLIEREQHAVRCLCTLSPQASLSLTRSFVLPQLGQNLASLESLQHAVLAAVAHCLSSQGRLNCTQHTNITRTPVRLLVGTASMGDDGAHTLVLVRTSPSPSSHTPLISDVLALWGVSKARRQDTRLHSGVACRGFFGGRDSKRSSAALAFFRCHPQPSGPIPLHTTHQALAYSLRCTRCTRSMYRGWGTLPSTLPMVSPSRMRCITCAKKSTPASPCSPCHLIISWQHKVSSCLHLARWRACPTGLHSHDCHIMTQMVRTRCRRSHDITPHTYTHTTHTHTHTQ
jgi:hypothetical protein